MSWTTTTPLNLGDLPTWTYGPVAVTSHPSILEFTPRAAAEDDSPGFVPLEEPFDEEDEEDEQGEPPL